MEKYCVFLFNSKTNEFGEVLLKGASMDEAVSEMKKLRETGLPAFHEKEETMKNKFKLKI